MFDKQSNAWKDGESIFWNCALWREAAENVVESLTKGMRVIVTGEVVNESWESNGEKRSRLKIQVDEVGPSLKYATAKVERKAKGGGAAATTSGSWGAANDPWATEPASDEVPF
jgi:single-strand DNA-binding protein